MSFAFHLSNCCEKSQGNLAIIGQLYIRILVVNYTICCWFNQQFPLNWASFLQDSLHFYRQVLVPQVLCIEQLGADGDRSTIFFGTGENSLQHFKRPGKCGFSRGYPKQKLDDFMENPKIKWFGGTPGPPGKLQRWLLLYAKMWLSEQVGFSYQPCFFLLSDDGARTSNAGDFNTVPEFWSVATRCYEEVWMRRPRTRVTWVMNFHCLHRGSNWSNVAFWKCGSVGNIPFCCIFLAVEQNSRTCFHVDRRSPYLKEAWPSDTGWMSHWIFTQLFSAPELWVRSKRVFLPTVPSI